MKSRSLSSILAQVLGAALLASAACGGATAEVLGDENGTNPSSSGGTTSGGTSGTSGGGTTPTKTPPSPPVPPNPPPKDAGLPDTGCNATPKLLKQGNGCADVWHQPCGIPAGVNTADGLDEKECSILCGKNPEGFKYWGCSEYMLDDLPGPSFSCYTCVEGRRPQGYDETLPKEAPTPVAAWLAHAADLERVSIDAFYILATELAHWGADKELVARCRSAARDEVRHARMLASLARREGAKVSEAPIAHGPVRSLFEVALENAVEGCVRETYGALVAGWQAKNASRPEIRRVMSRIVVDETVHAELAWDVHAWAMTLLSPEERALVEEAMTKAIADLVTAATTMPHPALVAELGLPSARDAGRLVLGLAQELLVPLADVA